MTRQSDFYGWKLLAIFWFILFANFAFPLYGASVVNTYMAEALHWDRTQLGTAYAIYQLMIGVPAPLIAVLIARKGVRFTAALGCCVVVAGALLMSFVVRTSFQVDLVYGVMIGLGAMTGGVLVSQTAINRWFNRYKGLAITLVHTGGTFGGFVAARSLDKVIRVFGGNWRAGWWLIAGVSTICALLAMLFVRERPADLGQFPDGGASGSGGVFRARDAECARAQDQRTLDAARRAANPGNLVHLGFAPRIQHRLSRSTSRTATPICATWATRLRKRLRRSPSCCFARCSARCFSPRLPTASSRALPGPPRRSSSPGECSLPCTLRVLSASTSTPSCWVVPSVSAFSAHDDGPAANYYGVKGYPPVISLMMVIGTTAGALGARIAGMVFDRVHSYAGLPYTVRVPGPSCPPSDVPR